MSSVYARRAGIKRAYPIKASTKIAAVTPVFLLAGLAVPFSAATGTGKFVGISTFEKDNTGADGDLHIEIERQEFAFTNKGDVTNAKIGEKVYFVDAVQVSVDSSTNSRPLAGTVTQLEGNLVWVLPAVA
ncbi:hypothetical protein SL034_001545 [Vibrio harveyi]|nr:hypothetical protein [Vibrio harveyi]